jgi:hypothetical protein
MKWRMLAYILLAALVITACQQSPTQPTGANPPAISSTQPATNPAASSANAYQYIFDATPNPINIRVTLDTGQSVEATIPVEGGTLSATGSDGTTYTLEIPSDALLNETMIKMTPATSVSDLPFGGEQTHAVQLEPEGLFLNNFATLTIVPPQELPVDQQIFFGYKAAGQELSLAAPEVDSPAIKLKLLHFSGYGVTKGFLADTEPLRQRLGGDAEARLQSLAAEVLGRERQRQLLGQESEVNLGEFFDELMRQYEEQVVKPRVAAAGESCAAGRLALQTVLGLERQRQLLGISDDGTFNQQVGDLMKTVSHVCVQEEYELCVEDHIIHRMIPVWLGLERQYQLLGITDGGSTTPELEEAKDLTRKCLTFELAFESDGNFDDGGGGGYHSVVKAKVPLRFVPEEMTIKGQAPLVNESFEFKAPDCSVTNNRGGSMFEGISLVYIADTHSPSDELGYVRDYKLTYFPGVTSESFSVTCDDSTYTSPPSGLWSGIFTVLHYPEADLSGTNSDQGSAGSGIVPDMSGMMGGAGMGLPGFSLPQLPSGGGYIAEDWELQSGDYLAKKEWIKEDAGLGLTEAGTLKLYHRPGN